MPWGKLTRKVKAALTAGIAILTALLAGAVVLRDCLGAEGGQLECLRAVLGM